MIFIIKKFTINNIATSIANRLNSYAGKDDADLQKMILGMEILLHNIPKLILTLAVAYLLDILPQAIAVWLPFVCIRIYAGGLHAKSGISCAGVTLLLFVVAPYVLKGAVASVELLILIFIATGFLLYKYAPADTANRPILGKKKRVRLKKGSVAVNFILMITTILFIDKTLYLLVALGVSFAVTSTLPLMYKLLGRSTNNYEQYEQ